MCCETGVCGNSIDIKLVKFAADLEWLKTQNVTVTRHGLASEPEEFIKNEVVKTTLQKDGNDCLPLIIINNQIVSKGCYPDRQQLAKICGIAWKAEYSPEEIEEIQIEACSSDCDCHDSPISENTKKILFIIILLLIAVIITVKLSCKAGAAEFNAVNKVIQTKSNVLVADKKVSSILGKYVEKINQAKSNKEVAFVFIPSKVNGNISDSAKESAISAQKRLQNKNIKVSLFTLKTNSADYNSTISKVTPPAIMILNKGQGRGFAAGEITEANILQAYMAATLDCGEGCPCHNKQIY